MKTCNTCQASKDESEFRRVRFAHDGLCLCCMVCHELVGADGLTNFQRRCNPPQKIIPPEATTKASCYERARLRRRDLKKKYGLTLDDFDLILSEQGGACALCKDANKKLCIDHDHASGKVRAILCSNCNTAIGLLGDSARLATAAAGYLTKHGNL